MRNTTLVAVSRAPYEKIAAFRERMGWTFPWYSSYGSDFNYDFHATLDDRRGVGAVGVVAVSSCHGQVAAVAARSLGLVEQD